MAEMELFVPELKMAVKQKKIRCYVTKENANQFPHLTNFIEELRSEKVYKKNRLFNWKRFKQFIC